MDNTIYIILILGTSIVLNVVAIRIIYNLKDKYSGRIKRSKKEKIYITEINEKVELNPLAFR